MSMKLMAAALCLAAAAGAADQRPVPAHDRTAPPKTAAARPQAPLPDAQIEAAIRARFARSKINADHFKVRVQSGVATIEGHTDVIQHKGVATRLAKSGGALAVTNRIEISDAARAKAAGNLQEGRRRVQVSRGEARSETGTPVRR